jgi:hypothetical protein
LHSGVSGNPRSRLNGANKGSRSVLDFNPINTIASHMSYWSDEDVSHFVLSQMLANKVKTPDPKAIS